MIDGFGYEDTVATQERVLPMLRLLAPHAVQGLSKIRVGRDHDGGYVMLDDFAGIAAAYSLGIDGDVSWDLEMAARGIDIYQYDHTIDALPADHPRFHWSRIGIEGLPSPAADLETLEALMTRNGHAGGGDLILKCDIEGAEWTMLGHLPSDKLALFRQIVIEMHAFQELWQPGWFADVNRALTNLARSHCVVHVHANNNAAYAIVGGIPIPAALELTFARRAGREVSLSNEVFPTALDMPCTQSRADYALGTFRF